MNKINFGHRKNAELILKYSTALPFKTVWSRFTCAYCWEIFDDISVLRDHVTKCHESFNIRDVFYKLSDKLVNVDITDLKCKLCKKNIDDLESLTVHLSKAHNKTVNYKFHNGVMPFKRQSDGWICVFCDQIFDIFKDIKRHMPNHFQNFICNSCNMSFVTDHAFRLHVTKKECSSISFKEFRYIHQLRHRRNAQIIVEYSTLYPFRMWNNKLSCVFCRDVFKNPDLLRAHLGIKHKEKTNNAFYKSLGKEFLKVDITNLKCKICLAPFDSVENLARHLKVEHNKAIDLKAQLGLLPFKFDTSFWICLYCKQDFADCQSLIRHTSGHFMNYVCDICGEGFITEHALTVHSRTPHENIYPCYRCSASFSSIEDKKSHIKERHTKTPYVCYVCKDKPRFASWDLKQKHLLEEHNVEPNQYECHECNSVFNSRSAKYKHVRKMHSVKQFCCKYCNSNFTSSVILHNHITKKHDNLLP